MTRMDIIVAALIQSGERDAGTIAAKAHEICEALHAVDRVKRTEACDKFGHVPDPFGVGICIRCSSDLPAKEGS